MTDKVGVLGSSQVSATGTNTAYTVPSGKGARFRVFFRGIAGNGSSLSMLVDSMEVFRQSGIASGTVVYSSVSLPYNTGASNASVDGTTEAKTAMPYGRDFWLAAAGLFQYSISSAAFQEIKVAAVGAEVDVT